MVVFLGPLLSLGAIARLHPTPNIFMIHDDYLQLRRDISGSTPNEAIAGTPLFATLCDALPFKVAALCIESPTVDRTDLLAGMNLGAEECEELLMWLVMNLDRIAESNRGCFRVLVQGAAQAFLRARHPQTQGSTLGGYLMAKSAEWAMDIFAELGVNPLYDDAGNLCLHEFLRLGQVPIVSTLRYGVNKGLIDPTSEEVLYHWIMVNAQNHSMDLLMVMVELQALGFSISEKRLPQLFARIAQVSNLSEKSPIAYMLLCQRLAQREPALLDARFCGEGVLGKMPCVEAAYATYSCLDRVWTEPSIWGEEYVQAHGPELLQELVKHSYQDGLALVELVLARPVKTQNDTARRLLEKAVQHGKRMHIQSDSAPNEWIALYQLRAQGFDFTPMELALVDCTLAALAVQAQTMRVEEQMWPHALYRLANVALAEKNYKSEVLTKIEKYKKLAVSQSYYSLLDEAKHPAAVTAVLGKMQAFLQARPARMQTTAFMGALSKWVSQQNDPVGCVGFYLQKYLVLGPEAGDTEPVPAYSVAGDKKDDIGDAIAAGSELLKNAPKKEAALPVMEAQLYTKDALKAYSEYVTQQPDRKRNVEFLKRLVAGKDERKTLARSAGVLEKLQSIRTTFEHFGAVIDHVENHVHLCEKGDGAFYIPPALLVGGPGIGKTFFLHELARIVSTRFEMIGMEGVTAGFDITGLTEGYSNGGPGKLLLTLMESPHLNPIILLDEIDKAGGDSRYAVVNRLLPLLERYTAQKFKDECFPLEVDASKIVWFSTANDASVLSGPIKSRFDIFEIAPPNAEQKNAMTQGVYQRLRSTNAWGVHLDEQLPQDVLDVLSAATTPGAARDVRRIVTSACAQAIRHDRRTVEVAHLGLPMVPVYPWNAPAHSPGRASFINGQAS